MARRKITWCKVINVDHDRKAFDITGPKDKENYAAAVRATRQAQLEGRNVELLNTAWYGIYEDIPTYDELVKQYEKITGYEWDVLVV